VCDSLKFVGISRRATCEWFQVIVVDYVKKIPDMKPTRVTKNRSILYPRNICEAHWMLFHRSAWNYKLYLSPLYSVTGKNGFVTATELGTTNKIFVAATKNFAAATKRFVNGTKHFIVVTKYFCYPYFSKWFCWYNKTFFFRVDASTCPLKEERSEFDSNSDILLHCSVYPSLNYV